MIPGSRRSPGEGNGNPLQYSCLENSMDEGAWRATVDGLIKSQTLLNTQIQRKFKVNPSWLHQCLKDRWSAPHTPSHHHPHPVVGWVLCLFLQLCGRTTRGENLLCDGGERSGASPPGASETWYLVVIVNDQEPQVHTLRNFLRTVF